MGINKLLGVGAIVTVKASNLKPTGVLKTHFGNDYPTAKVENLVVCAINHDCAGKLVGIKVSSAVFKEPSSGDEVIFECKCGCAAVTTPAPKDARIQVGAEMTFRSARHLNVRCCSVCLLASPRNATPPLVMN